MITFRRLGRLGRFGNRLFQYAGTRLYAELNGFEFSVPAWEGDAIFGLQSHPLRFRDRFLSTVQLCDLSATGWAERLLTPLGLWCRDDMARLWRDPQDNIDLYGYMQDVSTRAMLCTHTDRIRSWFTFQRHIDTEMRRVIPVSGPWVAVHIRHGDMVKREGASSVADASEHARRLSSGRPVYIATDTPAIISACSDLHPFSLASLPPFIPPWLADFWMLRHASILIGSGSTFAWWAAFLGGMEYWAPPLNSTWLSNSPPPITRQDVH